MTAEVFAGPVGVAERRRRWLRSLRLMLRWEIAGSRLLYPILAVSQILVGAGFVLGFGLLHPNLDSDAAAYLATGAVVMSLILVGLVVTPQIVAQQKMQGSYDYVWSMPVPRSTATMASTTLAAAAAIPGIVVALMVASWRFDITFTLDATVIPAFLLTLLCGSFLGAAVAHSIDSPRVTLLFTQLGMFFIIGFSPVSFPADRLPGWLATTHDYLPIHHMALAVRSSLTDGIVESSARSWVILTLWTMISIAVTGAVLVRRR